jgi:hypothetical protein
MAITKLLEARKAAERAVSEMADGDLKVKAFEVILGHLLAGRQQPGAAAGADSGQIERGRKSRKSAVPASAGDRVLALKEEGFFKDQPTIGEVREALKAHGWNYPVTSLSGTMQTLVQQRKLRRQREKKGNKKVYRYSNP